MYTEALKRCQHGQATKGFTMVHQRSMAMTTGCLEQPRHMCTTLVRVLGGKTAEDESKSGGIPGYVGGHDELQWDACITFAEAVANVVLVDKDREKAVNVLTLVDGNIVAALAVR